MILLDFPSEHLMLRFSTVRFAVLVTGEALPEHLVPHDDCRSLIRNVHMPRSKPETSSCRFPSLLHCTAPSSLRRCISMSGCHGRQNTPVEVGVIGYEELVVDQLRDTRPVSCERRRSLIMGRPMASTASVKHLHGEFFDLMMSTASCLTKVSFVL
jgi:hypothetical protein